MCCDWLRPEETPGANDFRDIRKGILANAPEFLAKIHWVCYTEIMMDWREFSGKRICVAVSGGIDSMSLLHMLKSRADECGFSLSVVHCEHGIRGTDSLEDARFVGEICRGWGIPLFFFSADCPAEAAREGVSLETAARNFRYRSFQSLLDTGKADFIATAHHLGDEAETVLFRLCRGASLTGAKGMTERRDRYLRPLLGISREEIRAYAAENKVPFREDQSNYDAVFTRNKLRLEILPRLEEAIPGAAANLCGFARLAAEDDALLYALSEELSFRVPPMTERDTGLRLRFSEKAPLFRRACLSSLKELGVEKDYTSRHLDSVFSLQSLQTGSRISLPDGIVAVRSYDCIAFFCLEKDGGERAQGTDEKALVLEKGDAQIFREGRFRVGRYEITVSPAPDCEWPGRIGKTERKSGKADKTEQNRENGKSVGGTAEKQNVSGSENPEGELCRTLFLDGDLVPENAVFRTCRPGDRFEKFGGGEKSLNRYYIDKKIPQALRAEFPVLADEKGRVYLICGVEISAGVRITDNTARPLKITLRKTLEEES